MSVDFKDHFSALSASYALFRPRYPAALADWLAATAPGRDAAWDCGCGTGQLSLLLAERFARIAATDASPSQVAEAEPHARVTYAVAPAEASGLPDASVDLVAVGQAAHWFDLPAFYAEARRVGRPGALLALISYGLFSVDEGLDPILHGFHRGTLGPWWPPERRLVDEGYRDIHFPFADLPVPDLAIEVTWRLPELTGYIGTWSALKRYRSAEGDGALTDFLERLQDLWGDPGRPRRVRFPLAIRAAFL